MTFPSTRRTLHLAIMATALAVRPALLGSQSPREPWPGLDTYIESARAAWNVPGLALAIIRNDSLIYAKGFGVRATGKADLVTPRTVFAIGSSHGAGGDDARAERRDRGADQHERHATPDRADAADL